EALGSVAPAAEFGLAFVVSRKKVRAVAAGDPAPRIGGDESADSKPAFRHGACRPEAAFEAEGIRAVAGARGPQRENRAGGFGRLKAEVPIGRLAAPGLVAAVDEVEQARARNDGHAHATGQKSAPDFRKIGQDAAC